MLAFGAVCESAISAIPDAWRVTVAGVVSYTAIESDDRKLYAATEPYISRLADTPSGQPINGTLEKLPRFDRSIIGGDGFSGLTNGWGDAGLINAERLYDNLVSGYAVDGREVVFKAGEPNAAYSSFLEVARVIATGFTVNGQFLTAGLQDKGFKLNVPTQPNLYLGIGEYEGGVELTGKRRNMALGSVKNITPVLLIAPEQLLEVNGGRPVQAITDVFDKMYPLTFQADYATTRLLRDTPIADGAYGTCLADGRLRTGAPYQQLTCDVQGDNFGGYVNTTGTIMRRIISITGCIGDPAEVDAVAFANLESDQGASIGYYLDQDSTEAVAETFAKLTKGIDGFCGFTRLGMFQAGVFKPPGGTPAASYTDHEIIGDIDVEKLPSTFDPPPWRQRVAYERNWTIVNDPVAGAATADAARAAWAATPYKIASTSDAAGAAIKEDRLQAQDPPVKEAYFASAADALVAANASLALANSGYGLFRVLLKTHPFTHDICQAIRLTTGQLQFDGGKLARIAAISDIPEDNSVELRVLA